MGHTSVEISFDHFDFYDLFDSLHFQTFLSKILPSPSRNLRYGYQKQYTRNDR